MRLSLKHTNIYFTSDHHFHYANIIKFCHRPFQTVEEMDEELIKRWNEVVPKGGIVFHLGDLLMTANLDYLRLLVSRLNGTIHLVYGNHDYQNRLDREVAKQVFGYRGYDVVELTVFDNKEPQGHISLFMSHYPHLFWHSGSYHLHGHVHGGPISTANEVVPFHPLRYDVGVDNNDFYPISYNQLIEIYEQRKINCRPDLR